MDNLLDCLIFIITGETDEEIVTCIGYRIWFRWVCIVNTKADENYITKSPITPVNTAFNATKVLEHGIFTEQDIADMPEHSSINSRYKISFKTMLKIIIK